mmetsp:Transcript_2425/g.6311  ORF Transcript_2425/g.6311 Transcript_2425/m.6311 type:complete len:267 (-) Transcript_2425:717-1517(-)
MITNIIIVIGHPHLHRAGDVLCLCAIDAALRCAMNPELNSSAEPPQPPSAGTLLLPSTGGIAAGGAMPRPGPGPRSMCVGAQAPGWACAQPPFACSSRSGLLVGPLGNSWRHCSATLSAVIVCSPTICTSARPRSAFLCAWKRASSAPSVRECSESRAAAAAWRLVSSTSRSSRSAAFLSAAGDAPRAPVARATAACAVRTSAARASSAFALASRRRHCSPIASARSAYMRSAASTVRESESACSRVCAERVPMASERRESDGRSA